MEACCHAPALFTMHIHSSQHIIGEKTLLKKASITSTFQMGNWYHQCHSQGQLMCIHSEVKFETRTPKLKYITSSNGQYYHNICLIVTLRVGNQAQWQAGVRTDALLLACKGSCTRSRSQRLEQKPGTKAEVKSRNLEQESVVNSRNQEESFRQILSSLIKGLRGVLI